jgi:hypothetical protein
MRFSFTFKTVDLLAQDVAFQLLLRYVITFFITLSTFLSSKRSAVFDSFYATLVQKI